MLGPILSMAVMGVAYLSVLAWLPKVLSHGYMANPKTRAELICGAAGEPMWSGDGCLNHRSGATSNIKWPQLPGHVPGTGIIPDPVCSGEWPLKQHLKDQLNTPGPVQAVYQQGQVIDVAFNIQANHGGKYSYRLCTDGSDQEACFKSGQLKFSDGETWKDVRDGTVTYQVRLPADVACDRCTLSGRWDAGKDENQVWVYCADIKIEGSGSSNPAPTPAPDSSSGNKIIENAPGVGGWGGSCTCPDGQVYQVGDNGDACGSLACVGGTPGTCNQNEGAWSNRQVNCAKASQSTSPSPLSQSPSPSPLSPELLVSLACAQDFNYILALAVSFIVLARSADSKLTVA